MGIQRDGGDGAAMAFFGDGASSQGDVNEAFVWASVVQRARSSSSARTTSGRSPSRSSARPGSRCYQRAEGFGFPGVRVDGNDVLAVLAVTRAALARAREGSGPTLIEAYTYRMGAHTTSDDPTRYRLAAELETWKLKDPIERVKAYLSRSGAGDADVLRRASTPRPTSWPRTSGPAASRCLIPSRCRCSTTCTPRARSLLDEEREQMSAYLASFERDVPSGGH